VTGAAAVTWCVAGALMAVAPARPAGHARQGEPLAEAARRAAQQWQRHDFAALVDGSPGVMVRLGGAEPSAPLAAQQAVLTLQAFAGGVDEEQAVVSSVREVEEGRGYAEVQRTFVAHGTSARRTQTLYLEWRRVGGRFVVVGIRVVP
jgi:hypothetical protein